MTPLADLLEDLHSDDHDRVRRSAWVVGLSMIALLALAALLGHVNHEALRHDEPPYRCFAERSDTIEGVEVIAYPPNVQIAGPHGVEVQCPR